MTQRFLTPTVVLLLMAGTLYRLWPIAAGMPALGYFFITEDGYLMLTVARNIAIGNGMSVSEGTIATNGVQPLATFLFAIPYWITGGDKVTSLIGIHLIHAATALAAVFAIRALAARALATVAPGPVWPWAVALLWFLAPLLMRHSMNGLETSLYTLVLVLTLLSFARLLDRKDEATLIHRLQLGAMCGLAVLARNDAVFLVTSLFLVWTIWELFVLRRSLSTMLARLVPPGLFSIAVAAPWLVSNQMNFGSIVPVSGAAQSQRAVFAENITLIPVKLFEYVFPMLPIPGPLESNSWVIAVAGVGVGAAIVIFCLGLRRRGAPSDKAFLGAYLLFALAVSSYYGLFFGAGHFVSRYLAPLAPLLILAGVWAAFETGRLLVPRYPDVLARTYVLSGGVLVAALLVRALLPGTTVQGHQQVANWVAANVPEHAWVGAPQTGTLGYWHDRTLNLDGKVNPAALAAKQTTGHVLDYVTDSDVDYIVDWAGVGNWVHFDIAQGPGAFAETFELILQDKAANLSVQKRRTLRHTP